MSRTPVLDSETREILRQEVDKRRRARLRGEKLSPTLQSLWAIAEALELRITVEPGIVTMSPSRSRLPR